MNIEKQQRIMSLLLIDSDNNNNLLLSYILVDILTSEKNNKTHYKIIYNTLNIEQQQILNNVKKYTELEINKLLLTDDESIPYVKRILLMKCSNNIKNKALEKLKEIKNSKGGETTSKAQQYLDGVLKIPFGIYKQEYILNFISEFIIEIEILVRELSNCKISFNSLISPTSSIEIDKFFIYIKNKIIELNMNSIISNLNKLKIVEMKSILKQNNSFKNGKKDCLKDKIIDITPKEDE